MKYLNNFSLSTKIWLKIWFWVWVFENISLCLMTGFPFGLHTLVRIRGDEKLKFS